MVEPPDCPPKKGLKCRCGHTFSDQERLDAEKVLFGTNPGWVITCFSCGETFPIRDTRSPSAIKAARPKPRQAPRPRPKKGERIADELVTLRTQYKFSYEHIAIMLGAKKQDVTRWRNGTIAPASKRRYARRIVRLAKVMVETKGYPPEDIPTWFVSRDPRLDHRRPQDLIRTDFQTVLEFAESEEALG